MSSGSDQEILSKTIPIKFDSKKNKKYQNFPSTKTKFFPEQHKISYHNVLITKEKLEIIFQDIQLHSQKTTHLKLILSECQINYELPKQIFFTLKDLSKMESLKLNFCFNPLHKSFFQFLKEALFQNKLKVFALELAGSRELSLDFFSKFFDERFFIDFKELKSLKLNLSCNFERPEKFDLKFLQNLLKLKKLEKLSLDFSKNSFKNWKKFCHLLPDLKQLTSLKLNFYGCPLSVENTLEICSCTIRCDELDFFKIDLRPCDFIILKEISEIAYIEAMASIFREKFNNDKAKFKIWY